MYEGQKSIVYMTEQRENIQTSFPFEAGIFGESRWFTHIERVLNYKWLQITNLHQIVLINEKYS